MTSVTPNDKWVVGIDVGGTFTDIVAYQPGTGELRDGKVLTTSEQEVGVLDAITEVGLRAEEIHELVHGHTVGINAVLSRAGAKTALLATDGHRDLLDMGRMNREFGPQFYDPTWLRPHQKRPIVKRQHRYGVAERIGADGSTIQEVSEESVRSAARLMAADGVSSVAICFLNSYNNPRHEQRAAEIVREELPDAYVQTSALYPVTKEHERTTTVALDAYVGPVVTSYLRRLSGRLEDAGFGGSIWIMTMNGGVVTLEDADRAPVFQLVSGPVGGVSGAVHLAQTSEKFANLLTMDVGGTSTDVSSIVGASTPLTDLWTIETGITLTMPLVDVSSVGSGAGSIISVDSLGSLRTGPASAGSVPGPACYGRGGKDATLTDACAAMGILQPDLFAGGSLHLDLDLAQKALDATAIEVGLTGAQLAEAAYLLACEDIAAKIRSISVYRGSDMREFGLLAFGAAGPMLANQVAEIMGVDHVVVPPSPGQFSALALLGSDLRITRARSPMTTLQPDAADDLEDIYCSLENAMRDELQAQGLDPARLTFERAFFAMYSGQTWDNRLPLESGPVTAERIPAMAEHFHTFYQEAYGFSAKELPIVCTSVEVTGVYDRGLVVEPSHDADDEGSSASLRSASVAIPGGERSDVPIYKRESLRIGDSIDGPALVVESFATTFVLPGWTLTPVEGDCLTIHRLTGEEKS